MVGLPKLYQDVYETSKDVVRLKQRHLIKEVLKRLNSISLPEETSITTLTNDQIRFFFGDILSLIIDNDSTLQAEAINAIGKFLLRVQPSAYQDNSEWPIIRDRIVQGYSNSISKVRDSSNNANWYKIWCLLIQVLDQDIIRSVLIINKLLAIVEQSFKSPDLEVRAQAFICWKVLVQMFSKYNELIPTKRVKLVSIPFRSSQAKNLYGAETKFEAYWYFLVKLSESQVNNGNDNVRNSLELHHELVFGSFLQFCFGSSVKGGISTLKQFPKMKEMAVFVLIAMLHPEIKEIDLQLENYNLEKPKEAIVSEVIMKNYYKAIMRSCFEATLIIIEQCNSRKKLLELLWHGLIHQILQTKNAEVYKECCSIIKQLIQTDKDNPGFLMKPNILTIVETFGSHYNYLYDLHNSTANYVQIFEITTCLTDILLNEDYYFPLNVYEPIVKNIYDIEKYKGLLKFWELQKDLIEYMLTSDQLNDFTNFQVKISIWKMLSMVLRNYMDSKLFEFRLQSKSEIVNKWIFWPLKKCGWANEGVTARVNKTLDNTFFLIWKRIMHSSSNAEGKSNFINLLIPSMKTICDKREKIPNFDDILACYIDCMEKSFDKNSKPSDALDLIKTILSKTPSKNCGYNKSVEKLSNYICNLSDSQIGLIIEELKAITTTLVQAEKFKHITKNCFEMYKKSVLDLLKKDSFDKKYLKEFRNALKSDEFVIIPSVWALNPERLTEHQKEKMKEKNDNIPALYNDMNSDSHSQDSSSIKPWTPNKIVINRGKEQLIISSPKTTTQSTEIETNIMDAEINKSPFKSSPGQLINKSPFKKPNNKIESPPVNSVINIEENEILEKESNENMAKDFKEEKRSLRKANIKRSKSVEPKRRSRINLSSGEEKFLKFMNIEIKDEKKKNFILNSLKVLQIDTVEGKNLSYDGGLRPRKSSNPKKITGNLKNKSLNDNKESTKPTKRTRKSLSFEKEKSKDSNPKNEEHKKAALKKQDEKQNRNVDTEKIEVHKEVQQSTTKFNIGRFQSSNTTLNSEDEVVESSQRPEANTTRRSRRPSFNLTIDETKRSSLIKSSTKTPKNSRKMECLENDLTKVISDEAKTRSLRSSSNSPMIEDNDIKNTEINSIGKKSPFTTNKNVSDMDAELNTELLPREKSILQSPTKSHVLQHNVNSKTRVSDNKCEEIESEKILCQVKQNGELVRKVNTGEENPLNMELNASISRGNSLFLQLDLPSKSPRKRLQYDALEENISKINSRTTPKVLKDLETDTNNTDSIMFPSLIQSPNVAIDKQNRYNISRNNLVPDTEISPKIQKLLEVLDKELPKITRSSPRKSPNLRQEINIAEMETQLNTENISNTQKTTTQSEIRTRSPRKLPIWAKTKISEMDTEPNTEVLGISTENKANVPKSPSTPKRNGDIYQYFEEKLIESPAYSPIKSVTNSLKKSLNRSIIASPECRNADEKIAEFMNDTLNISPIPIENEKNESNLKNITSNNADRLFNELKASKDIEIISIEEIKHTSPTRKSIRPASLNSPPDRKTTNNSTSPVPKPKGQSGLTGRGAQLINMIRNRKIDPTNRFTSSPFGPSKQDEISNSQEQLQQNQSSPPKSTGDNNTIGTVGPPTPVQVNPPVRDLLTFSKVLPSPYASPSASILKRKLRKESFDDFESPANKRKRVSFHDPPVSVTKEYVKHIEEDKPPHIRPNKVFHERTSTPTNISMKHSLKRKNRIDSMLELARFNDSPNHHANIRMIEVPRKSSTIDGKIINAAEVVDENNVDDLMLLPPNAAETELHECDSSKIIVIDEPITGIPQTSVEMDSLKFNATADSTTNPQHNLHQRNIVHEDDEELRLISASPSIYFTDEAAVLNYVIEKYSFDEIYEKYSERKNTKDFLTNKLVRTIFKDLSTVMEKDIRIKTNVLEMLSEKHPKEFLDHAIQENLSSVVCERLNTNSVIDFICEIFKNNVDSRKMILDKISSILTTERFNEERHEYFKKLLHYEKMSDEEIIKCIEIITKNRR